MKKSLIPNQVKAALLALLFVSAWLSKSAHGFFLHHHDEHPVCHSAYQKGQHLHDERYAGEDCSWCHFLLSVPHVLPPITALCVPDAPVFASIAPVFYSKPTPSNGFDLTLRRGPPVAKS